MEETQFLQRQSQFWNDIAQNWSLENKNPVVGWYHEHNNFPHYETQLFRNMDRDVLKGKKVLEVGCGPGRNIIKFNGWFKQLDGCDIAPGTIEKAKINLNDAGVPLPTLFVMDGKSLPMVENESYDIVFMVISHQHITSRAVRLNLYREYYRILKQGGFFCFQTGFGPGHPRSVDYFTEHYENESEFLDKDVRVESMTLLQYDLEDAGFKVHPMVLTETCHDEHPQWLWVQAEKK